MNLKKKEMDALREVLLDKRRNILSKLIKDSNRYHEIFKNNAEGDMADIANDAYEKYLLYDLSLNEKEELAEIEAALKRMDDDTYGICETCKCEIPKQRLQVQPFAKMCIKCREKFESKMK